MPRTDHDVQLERVRRCTAALPEVVERPSHGAPAFFIRGKTNFVSFVDDHHGDGILGIWCAAPPGEQSARLAEDPVRFFRPPYVGPRGWLGVRLDRDVDDDLLEELVTEAWRTVAPAKLRSAFDAGR